ncbi:MAG TPA: hypothetical protein VK633_11145, partial [Verrucomicrobiae bacterium]|nr:hypothetical protein [Verrucomicrobiae bacterium]
MKRLPHCRNAFVRAIALLILPSAFAVPVEWRVQDGGNGHTYDLVGDYRDLSQRWTWADAKNMAE